MSEHDLSEQTARIMGRLTSLEVLIGFLFAGQKDRGKRFDGADQLLQEMWEKAFRMAGPDITPEQRLFFDRMFKEAKDNVASIRHVVG